MEMPITSTFVTSESLSKDGSSSSAAGGSGGSGGGSSSGRRTSASQACEVCRARKTRCDEQRPRCSICRRFDVACVYREPKTAKADLALTLLLSTVQNIERKIDQLAPALQNPFPVPQLPLHSFSIPSSKSTDVQRLLTWPEVRQLLKVELSDLPRWDGIDKTAEEWLIHISHEFRKEALKDERAHPHMANKVLAERNIEQALLDRNYVGMLSNKYFQSFHSICPILDAKVFHSTILPRVQNNSFSDKDDASALVLVVLALGAVAYEGSIGVPVTFQAGDTKGGIRGGTVLQPPGLNFLNEAQRKMGLKFNDWSLSSLQSHLLTAVYFCQCSRSLDYWRTAAWSCILCENLTRINDRWDTLESDQLMRCYWMCYLLEGGPMGQLGFNETKKDIFSSTVPLPQFLTASKNPATDSETFYQLYFLAHVSLRPIVDRIVESEKPRRNVFSNDDDCNEIPPKLVIKELERQLSTWRQHLPECLCWDDDESTILHQSTASISDSHHSAIDSISGKPDMQLILSAALQSRYKYAQYILWRPYIYRYLRFPNKLTEYDIICLRKAISTCLLWPISFPIFSKQRRLIPHLYDYSSIFFGVLIIMKLCASRQNYGLVAFNFENPDAVTFNSTMLLHWMRDMKVVHPISYWCWQSLKNVYHDHPIVKD